MPCDEHRPFQEAEDWKELNQLNKELTERNKELTQMLCESLRCIENMIGRVRLSDKVFDWWNEHKDFDAKNGRP